MGWAIDASGAEQLQDMARPYVLEGPVAGGWRWSGLSIARDRATFLLAQAGDEARVVLHHPDRAPETAELRGTHIALVVEAADTSGRAAARSLAERLIVADRAGRAERLWGSACVGARCSAQEERRDRGPVFRAVLGSLWSILALLLLLAIFFGLRREERVKTHVGGLALLFLGSLLLRWLLATWGPGDFQWNLLWALTGERLTDYGAAPSILLRGLFHVVPAGFKTSVCVNLVAGALAPLFAFLCARALVPPGGGGTAPLGAGRPRGPHAALRAPRGRGQPPGLRPSPVLPRPVGPGALFCAPAVRCRSSFRCARPLFSSRHAPRRRWQCRCSFSLRSRRGRTAPGPGAASRGRSSCPRWRRRSGSGRCRSGSGALSTISPTRPGSGPPGSPSPSNSPWLDPDFSAPVFIIAVVLGPVLSFRRRPRLALWVVLGLPRNGERRAPLRDRRDGVVECALPHHPDRARLRLCRDGHLRDLARRRRALGALGWVGGGSRCCSSPFSPRASRRSSA